MTFDDLAETPARVRTIVAGLRDVRARPFDGAFAAMEHLCHLRDIEQEGYAVRIARMLREVSPLLRDLDGDRLARERRYLEQDPDAALRDLAAARERSVALLRGAPAGAFEREGTFENLGPVTLAKLVSMMREHDAEHLRELAVIAALDRFTQNRQEFRQELESLCRVAGISAADPAAVRASAEATAEVLARHGVAHVRLLESDGAHPAVYGAVHVAPEAPTILIYGHHDVQPPSRLERWTTAPFEPTERDGRLYARGAADDKGGVMAHIAAAASYGGAPPCNLKFFIEGEEEIGSPHLGAFLDRTANCFARTRSSSPTRRTRTPACPRSRTACAACA